MIAKPAASAIAEADQGNGYDKGEYRSHVRILLDQIENFGVDVRQWHAHGEQL